MNWDAVAAIAQAVEALVVVAGASLIYWQLQQIRSEQTHKTWNALQWAVELIPVGDIRRLISLMESEEDETEEVLDIAVRLRNNLHLVSLAIESGYLQKELFFLSHASYLRWLTKEQIQAWSGVNDNYALVERVFEHGFPGASNLIEGAGVWTTQTDHLKGQPTARR